ALERVLARLVEAAADQPGTARADHRPRLVEHLHRDVKALAGLADDVVRRELDILEQHVAGVRGPLAQLLLLAPDADARRLAVDHERRDALVLEARIDRRKPGV